MTIARFFRGTTLKRRLTHLAIVVLPDEASAFQAYRLLHYHGISPENLAIVGEGYSSPERVGLMAPLHIAFQKARSFGVTAACSGIILSLVASLVLMPGWNTALVVLITGVLSGSCAAILGGLFGFLGEGSTASIYRHHLNHGRYLLLIEGPEKLVHSGQEVLGNYSATSLY
ncbi:hypothetical protein [Stenomitos frigidus]|uniref:Uncharacterized protein n=1 Tax=Stenomitos frigidus ULC18 TaxID=2107698 RepID=A0A2T1EDR7_9CYAN|nr:hypothetical protein [Stenomitos frigidus]PSB30864.1 hypothetical protein C7B82_08015 [Stenomitos frigidus ULC18]